MGWLLPKRENDLFQNIKIKKPRRHLPVEQLITREDIARLVDACDKPRDRALIMLMWDSGARISGKKQGLSEMELRLVAG